MSERTVLVVVALAAFITALDNTVVTIALPTIRNDLHLSLRELEWTATSYMLSFATLLLLGGRLTDLIGRRTALTMGLAVFGLSSLGAALAPTGAVLIVSRLVQGAGAALVLPATLAMLGGDVSARRRRVGAGLWTAMIGVALMLGPVIGGAIVQVAPWGWIFLLNVPVCLLCMAVLRPGSGVRRPLRGQLDLTGVVLSAVAVFALTWSLVQGQALVAVPLSLVAALLFVRRERTTAKPLINISLFRNTAFVGAAVAQVLWGLSINGIFFFTSLLLQGRLELSPVDAGLALLPVALGLLAGVPVSDALVRRLGVARTVGAGMVAIAVGLVADAGVDSHWIALLPGLVCVGLGSGLTTPMTAAVLEELHVDVTGIAAAVISTGREMSGVLGIALMGVLASYRAVTLFGAVVVLGAGVICALTLPGRLGGSESR